MKQFVKRNKLMGAVASLCVVLIVLSAWSWWHYIYSNPERVFNRMLSTSLSTASVTKKTTQAGGQAGAQVTSLNINPSPILDSTTTAVGNQRELIATPDASYVRFTDIDLSKLGVVDTSQDISGVLNVWGKSISLDGMNGGTGEYNQSLFGIVPVGRLSSQDRAALLGQMQKENVYNVDYSTTKRETVNGRPVYTYTVTIKPRAFISMLKSFSSYLGMNDFEQYDPNTYPESPLIAVSMQIDVWSSQLTKITYGEDQTTEDYSAYGALTDIQEPATYISAQELQAKLQQIR